MTPRRKQAYPSRRAGTNPRTGEQLVHWSEVQVSDPNAVPLAHYFVGVEVVNADGPRRQLIQVRAKPGLAHTEEVAELGKQEARKLGLVPTGVAEHS